LAAASQDKTPEFKKLPLRTNKSLLNDEVTRRDSFDVSPKEQGDSKKSVKYTPDNFKAACSKLMPMLYGQRVEQKFNDCASEKLNGEGDCTNSFKVRIPKFGQSKDTSSETPKVPPILLSIKNQCQNRTP
jgi:hypothetical protein